LCQPSTSSLHPPRLAKDKEYALSILDQWEQDDSEWIMIKQQQQQQRQQQQRDNDYTAKTALLSGAEYRRIKYYAHTIDDSRTSSHSSDRSIPLFGTLVRRSFDATSSNEANNQLTSTSSRVPGILLFHTGAGPHDIFLLYKAASIVNSISQPFTTNSHSLDDHHDGDGSSVVVLIADLISDESGWSWETNRTHFDRVRQHVFDTTATTTIASTTNTGTIEDRHHPILRSRLQAAINVIQSVQLSSNVQVDPTRIAALGWCLGGHAILELSRMRPLGMRSMITFHGVFDGSPAPPKRSNYPEQLSNNSTSTSPTNYRCEILVCNGASDPFVSGSMLSNAIDTFTVQGHIVSLLQLQGAKHGFTNPAQQYNPNVAFDYHQDAANKAWKQSIGLLARTLQLTSTLSY
jgi:dienelactone hydrolase